MVAHRWLTEIYEPVVAMAPPRASASTSTPAELFHEILEHRWYLSEQRRPGGQDIFETAATTSHATERPEHCGGRPRCHSPDASGDAVTEPSRAGPVACTEPRHDRLAAERRLEQRRAMTIRWIWLVPSKICVTFASRM